jgi:hypothetical protein
MATLRLLLEDDDGSLVDEMTIQLSEKQLLTILKGQLETYSIEECSPSGGLGKFSFSFKSTTPSSSNTPNPSSPK